jgi:pilus assembly protein Flp/PilA
MGPAHNLGEHQAAEGRRAMMKLGRFVVDFLKNEDGPTAVEYAVMLALIVVVCIAAISVLGSNANNTFTTVGSKISTAS